MLKWNGSLSFTNRKTKSELLPFFPVPTYLRVKLNILTFRSTTILRHCTKKLSTRVALLRRLAGSKWGAVAKILCTAAISLVYSKAKCCVPLRCLGTLTRLIDSVLNVTWRIVTGCLRSTPTDHPPILSSIQPAELCHLELSLAKCSKWHFI